MRASNSPKRAPDRRPRPARFVTQSHGTRPGCGGATPLVPPLQRARPAGPRSGCDAAIRTGRDDEAIWCSSDPDDSRCRRPAVRAGGRRAHGLDRRPREPERHDGPGRPRDDRVPGAAGEAVRRHRNQRRLRLPAAAARLLHGPLLALRSEAAAARPRPLARRHVAAGREPRRRERDDGGRRLRLEHRRGRGEGRGPRRDVPRRRRLDPPGRAEHWRRSPRTRRASRRGARRTPASSRSRAVSRSTTSSS